MANHQRVNHNATSAPDDLVQSRLTQVFTFLKELNELRNPVLRDLTGYLDVLQLDAWSLHPCSIIRRGDREEDDDVGAETAMAPVFARLEHLGIEPLGAASQSAPAGGTPLLDRIRRQAEAVRAQWLAEKSAEAAGEESGE